MFRRSTTRNRISSPDVNPNLSFTYLNRSASSDKTARSFSCWHAQRIACSNLSLYNSLFGNPVRVSLYAYWSITCSWRAISELWNSSFLSIILTTTNKTPKKVSKTKLVYMYSFSYVLLKTASRPVASIETWTITSTLLSPDQSAGISLLTTSRFILVPFSV